MQRLRVRYAKRGRLRFTSHRDFSRAFERAVFRARVPMAYSSGFNPHPRISYAGASPTGAASEAEYLELALSAVVDPDDVRRSLVAALPVGLDIEDVVVAGPISLTDLLQASRWRLETRAAPELLADAVRRFLAVPEVMVERMTKKGLRSFDCRMPVLSLRVEGDTLDLLVRHAVPAVRPDDVLAGLHAVGGLELEGAPRLTRLAQGPLLGSGDDATVGDPLATGP